MAKCQYHVNDHRANSAFELEAATNEGPWDDLRDSFSGLLPLHEHQLMQASASVPRSDIID